MQNFNEIIGTRGVVPITTEKFRSLYRHPVRGMYEDVGIVFNDTYTFGDLSVEWHHGYERLTKDAALFSDARPMLEAMKEKGVKQILVSALEHELLLKQTRIFNVETFFDVISGHHDLEAESKIERGVLKWSGCGVLPCETVVIGDSDHDLELANAIGCQAILVDTGHQSLGFNENLLLEDWKQKGMTCKPPLFIKTIKELNDFYCAVSF